MHYLWATLGLLCVALAMVGVVLPLVPTVPFLLLAAFFFARSSSRLHTWLLTHRTFGPLIVDWQSSGAIRPAAKKGGHPVGRRRLWPVRSGFGSGLCPDHSGRDPGRGHDLYLVTP